MFIKGVELYGNPLKYKPSTDLVSTNSVCISLGST